MKTVATNPSKKRGRPKKVKAEEIKGFYMILYVLFLGISDFFKKIANKIRHRKLIKALNGKEDE